MIKSINKTIGTSLVEVVFYFAIVGVLLLAATNFGIQVANVAKQSENLHEIQANIDFMSQKIVSTMQIADSIDDGGSTFDSDIGQLSLNVPAASKSPTIFYLSGENIYVKEGTSAAIRINSDSVKCTKLRFEKISYPKTPDQVIIDTTFEPKYTDIPNLEQTLQFHTSVSLRK